MSRAISLPMLGHISGTTLTVCLLILIERLDGNTLALTTLPTNIIVGGTLYYAMDSVSSTAVAQAIGTGVDNLDLLGILSSELITDRDIRAELYDLASVTISMINYMDTSMVPVILIKGWIGELTLKDISYVAEIRSLTQNLTQTLCDLTSQSCRVAQFGNARCQAIVHTNSTAVTAFDINNPDLLIFSDSSATGFYTNGQVRFTSGQNTGITKDIQSHYNGSSSSGGALIGQGGSGSFQLLSSPGSSAQYPSWYINTSTSELYATSNPSPKDSRGNSLTVTTIGGLSVTVTSADPADNLCMISTPGGMPLGSYQLYFYDGNGHLWTLEFTVVNSSLIGGTMCQINLQEPFPFPVEVGDVATLIEGCDRNFPTCKTKTPPSGTVESPTQGGTGNSVNFDGEAETPGNDQYGAVGR